MIDARLILRSAVRSLLGDDSRIYDIEIDQKEPAKRYLLRIVFYADRFLESGHSGTYKLVIRVDPGVSVCVSTCYVNNAVH